MAANLTEEQKEDIEAAFVLHDKSKKGRLDPASLGACLRYLGMNLPNGDLVQMAQGGGMDRAGLMAFLGSKFVAEESEGEIIKAFEVFDREGNGLISNPELRHVLTGMGERLDPNQVEGMIAQADQGDGQVDYRRLVSLLAENAKRK